jgi:hypothetical protein
MRWQCDLAGDFMDAALWILQGLLAAGFLMSGGSKLAKPRLEVAERFKWANDYSDTRVKLNGVAEVAGAIGVVAPWLFGIARVLTPVAALCLAILMMGAVSTHVKRKDGQFGAAMVLAALSIVVAWGRW